MCKEKSLKVRKLPKGVKFHDSYLYDCGVEYPEGALDFAVENPDYTIEDAPTGMLNDASSRYAIRNVAERKVKMLSWVKKFLKDENMPFDEFNGLAPTRANSYRAYEFTTLWIWAEIVSAIKGESKVITDAWCKKYAPALASVMKKYPKVTGVLISYADLKLPGNKLLDYSKVENADFDADHTDEGLNDEKAEAFKAWILKWSADATEKDKMRVRNWFQTQKSHRQIFAEINKVVGNPHKFNARLALFVERLFNKEGTEYFFEKTGFDTKEDLFMAYFERLTQFDEDTKKSFIKKYLV